MHEDKDDRDAFDTLFTASFPTVVRAVSFVVGDRRVAEEIAQDAFVQLLRHWGKVSRYERPDLWVRRVALRDAQRERRRTWRRPLAESSAAVPETVLQLDESRLDVLAAVQALAPKQANPMQRPGVSASIAPLAHRVHLSSLALRGGCLEPLQGVVEVAAVLEQVRGLVAHSGVVLPCSAYVDELKDSSYDED